MNVGVLILAAGGSRRLGKPKQLLRFDGVSMVRRLAEVALASKADHCTVVLGNAADLCVAELAGLPVSRGINSSWQSGMASSISHGIACVLKNHPETTALVILACDQPLVSATVVNELIETHITTGRSLVACTYADTRGVPALFGRSWFQRLLALQGDRGAKALMDPDDPDYACISFPGGAIDVDTEENYATALTEFNARQGVSRS